jgi:DNA (cytosine-5)-methyltransferase 1
MSNSNQLTHGSLFSGIGGFDLAAHWCGVKTLWQVEREPFCQNLLKQHFPKTKLFDDVTKVGKNELQPVSIISGGFPCQPFSHAGKRKGKTDNRYLWPDMFRVIKELQPNYIIGENVPGIITLALDEVLTSLESEGYHNETFVLPACGIGAWHKRDRVWIISYKKDRFNTNSRKQQNAYWQTVEEKVELLSNTSRIGHEESGAFGKPFDPKKTPTWETAQPFDGCIPNIWQSEPNVGRVAHGIPKRVDRIKGLGNSIVPQMAYIIFQSILQIESIIQTIKK